MSEIYGAPCSTSEASAGSASRTTIEWTQNPLAAIVRPSEDDRRLMRARIEGDLLRSLIARARGLIRRGSVDQAKEALDSVDGIEQEVDPEFADYLDALRGTHCGDCTCVAISCTKCWAESAIGIRTLAGLTKHTAHHIESAFGKDGARSIDEAIAALANYDPTPWPNQEDFWRQHLPRWREEASQAHAWLVRYRDDHFPSPDRGSAATAVATAEVVEGSGGGSGG